ncbi:CsbD family protein [Microterricola viridarii]|uniref:CsbD-like domain-containing protein n=1 Tax=Microterricola viridarii TaxID=412690 RepID=A0A0X8E4C7_9MICO|nr:CsbD family protein [Microterricola viridarii]AMB59482.1 hypothetical protein AWU67_12115 [Microterricola viridarii]
MSENNKIKNATEETVGKVKEGVGKATNNDSLKNEGRLDQAKANLKQAGEKMKDALTEDK